MLLFVVAVFVHLPLSFYTYPSSKGCKNISCLPFGRISCLPFAQRNVCSHYFHLFYYIHSILACQLVLLSGPEGTYPPSAPVPRALGRVGR